MGINEDKQPDAADHAFALVEQANRLAKLAPTLSNWEHDKNVPAEEQVSAARAVVSGGPELRKALWALETVAESTIKSHDDAQKKRLDAFFEVPLEGV
jgi:hypothetical protein